MTSRTCTKCGETKPLADFHHAQHGAAGRRGDCKVCYRRARRERYQTDPAYRHSCKVRRDRTRPPTSTRARDCYRCGQPMQPSRDGQAGLCASCDAPRAVRMEIGDRDNWICQAPECGRPVTASLHPNHTFGPALALIEGQRRLVHRQCHRALIRSAV